jgi:tRNA G18 (ribose-2'-O)-methylase SpoU
MLPRPLRIQPEPIEDPSDPRVAPFLCLKDHSVREEGFFVAEGALVIRQLLQSPYRIRTVLLTARGLAALGDDLARVDAPVYLVTQPVMTSITGFHFHRGALASAERRPPTGLSTVAAADRLLVAEGVSDNENLGGLFRNAAAFGVGGVVLDPACADPLYRRTVRVSIGQVLRLPFARVDSAPAAVAELQDLGFEVLALTPSADADDIRHVVPGRRQALVVGAEGQGLTAGALAAADRRIRITMAPGVDSLNVATAAAIALHHLWEG